MIAVPGQLTAYYYDYFTSHPPYYLSFSVLRSFVPSPYDTEAPYLIGRVYFNTGEDANANLWADAIANFGLIGVIPASLLLGVVLWLFDWVASGRDLRLVAPLAALAGLGLSNGALLTTILTGGIAFAMVLVAAMPEIGAGNHLPLQRSAMLPSGHAKGRQLDSSIHIRDPVT